MSTFTITALNGVSYAFILFLLAAGFSLTFGVMGVLNLAHGALYVLGAYFGLAVISQLDQFWLGVVVAAAGTWPRSPRHLLLLPASSLRQGAGTGSTHDRVRVRLADIILWIWGPFAKMGMTPSAHGVVRVGDLAFPIYRLVIIAIGLIVLAFLWWMQDRPASAPSSARAWTTRR